MRRERRRKADGEKGKGKRGAARPDDGMLHAPKYGGGGGPHSIEKAGRGTKFNQRSTIVLPNRIIPPSRIDVVRAKTMQKIIPFADLSAIYRIFA